MNTKRRAHCQLWHDWKERIIRIGDEQTSLQNQFDNLRNQFTDNSPRIEALETSVNALDGRLIIAETDIAEAEDRITACENDIDALETEVNALGGRVTITESDISAAETRITACESDIGSLESEVNSLDGRVSITESDIADAEDRISACEADIDRIDGELVDKTGDINALANRMSLAEADIDDLDARLERIETGDIPPTPPFEGDWTLGPNFELVEGGLKWTDLPTRSMNFRTAYTALNWNDQDYSLVYKIKITKFEDFKTRLYIVLRPDVVTNNDNFNDLAITNGAALCIEFYNKYSNLRTVKFYGQSAEIAEQQISENTDYYFHASREGNVETLRITSGSIDGTLLAEATGEITGEKIPIGCLQIGNLNDGTNYNFDTAYYMSGTLHDVTPEPPSWDVMARPPVPFKKQITITELASGGYVMLDILPPGRSSIMLTRIIVHSFTSSDAGWIDPSFIADDDTETTMIAGIQNTDEKGFDKLMPISDMSSKNAIKNIKFGVYGTGTVTAELTCYGYIY